MNELGDLGFGETVFGELFFGKEGFGEKGWNRNFISIAFRLWLRQMIYNFPQTNGIQIKTKA